MTSDFTLYIGDCIESMRRMDADSIQTCVTSPPYFGLRDYGVGGQLGLEPTPEEYIAKMVDVFREVRRVLKDDGTLWLNIGDSYANDAKWGGSSGGKHAKAMRGDTGIGRGKKHPGLKAKDLIGIPWAIAFALRADGWYLRQDIIWYKPNPMPEPVRDRCTKAHEHVFLLSKSDRYYFDSEAIKEPSVMKPQNRTTKRSEHPKGDAGRGLYVRPEGGTSYENRNKRDVWSVPVRPYKGAHFATYPPALVEPCILAGSRPGDIVFDPFGGSGTTAQVALQHGRRAVLCELNPDYADLIRQRVSMVEQKAIAEEFEQIVMPMHRKVRPLFHRFLSRINA